MSNSEQSRSDIAESLRMLGIEPSPALVDSMVGGEGSLLPVDPATGNRLQAPDEAVVDALRAAHEDTRTHTEMLTVAREQRRMLAALLHSRGHSYRWIGEQLGITAQAVEGFVKYRQRRQQSRDVSTTS